MGLVATRWSNDASAQYCMQCAGELPPPPLPHRPEAPSAPSAPGDEFSDEDLESDDAKPPTEASLSDEVVCPTCSEKVYIDSGVLDEGKISCPACGEELEFELDGDEDEEDGE